MLVLRSLPLGLKEFFNRPSPLFAFSAEDLLVVVSVPVSLFHVCWVRSSVARATAVNFIPSCIFRSWEHSELLFECHGALPSGNIPNCCLNATVLCQRLRKGQAMALHRFQRFRRKIIQVRDFGVNLEIYPTIRWLHNAMSGSQDLLMWASAPRETLWLVVDRHQLGGSVTLLCATS